MQNLSLRRLFAAAALLAVLLVSALPLAKHLSSPETYRQSIAYLDEKRTTVLELTAASAAASTAITMIPGDTATPIAEKLADLSSYFLVVVCAIFLEKYLITMLGYLSCRFLIPAACLLLLICLFQRSGWLKAAAIRIFTFAIAISLVIPAGIQVSRMIEETYEASIEATISAAKDATEEAEAGSNAAEEEQGLLSGLASSLKNAAAQVTARFENLLSSFIEALAVLIITSYNIV